MKTKPFSLIACTLVLGSCSKVRDMHDATMQMNTTTSQMNATTGDLSATSNKMRATMEEIFDSGRQGAALDLRTKHHELVAKSPKLEDKVTNAGLYFVAFEFQLWSRVGLDGKDGARDRLLRDAADEFFSHLLALTHWDKLDPFAGKNPLALGEADNERAAFNAYAATLERSNRKQELTAAESGAESLSMLQMIEAALLAGKQIRDGKASLKDFPPYVDIILSHYEHAVRLLRARYQFLGVVVLSQLTPVAKNSWEGFKYKVLGTGWDLDFSGLTESEIRLASFRLGEALRARDFLAGLGIEEPLHPAIRRIYSRARVKDLARQELSPEAGDQAAQQAQLELLVRMRDYAGADAAK